jgi:FMN phosphatase YigB (HAD superfamily)/membrane-associated phospholipid phosphatase
MTRRSDSVACLSCGQGVTVAMLGGLLAFAALAVLVGAHVGQGLDERVLEWARANAQEPLTSIALGLAWLGNWWPSIPLIAILVGVLAWRGLAAQARYVALTAAAALTLNLGLKLLFRRPPPSGYSAAKASAYAFPSGHTMSATAVATAVVLIAWPTRWRWPVLVAGAALAVGMGLSRVYLAVHWPSDVAAGWVMGVSVALAVRTAVRLPSSESHVRAPAPAAAGAGAVGGRATGRTSSAAHARAGATLVPRKEREAVRRPLEVVFLDWGDTLMVDEGAHAGPMVYWPQVRAVDGAQETLRALHSLYRVLVATNADDSGSGEVFAALARVGLADFVDGVVSSRDVRARKPDAVFYRAALLRAGFAGLPVAPESAVMVGDSWDDDVAGAKQAGLRAVWLRPRRAGRPREGPSPDATIRGLRELPGALARLGGPAPWVPRVGRA